jgi:hypothetical protein
VINRDALRRTGLTQVKDFFERGLKKHCFFQPQANETFFLQARKGTVKRLVGIGKSKKDEHCVSPEEYTDRT